MKRVKFIFFFSIIVSSIFCLNVQAKENPWSMIFLDVSSDIECIDKGGKSELDVLKRCLGEIAGIVDTSDTVMIFASGRYYVPFEVIKSEIDRKSSLPYLQLGGNTAVYDALLAYLKRARKGQRVLVVSNGIDNSSSVHPLTLGKVYLERGIMIDAVSIYNDADSITNDGDFYFPKRKKDDNFRKMSNLTGGVFKQVDTDRNDSKIMESLIAEIKNSHQKKPVKSGYDNGLISKILSGFPENKLDIVEVDTAAVINYGELSFRGLNEIEEFVNKNKENKYIGSDHILSDNNGPVNYFFSPSLEIMEEKLKTIKRVKANENYCKLYEGIPFELLPIIYYPGTGNKMWLCGLDFVIPDDPDMEDIEE